jgi:hypothetical protein
MHVDPYIVLGSAVIVEPAPAEPLDALGAVRASGESLPGTQSA